MAIMIKTAARDREDAPLRARRCARSTRLCARWSSPAPPRWTWRRSPPTRSEQLGAIAAFKGYHGFPAVLCTSVNSEVVHGIPIAKRVLTDGDIISIDCGVIVDGYYSDAPLPTPSAHVALQDHKASGRHQASLEKAIQQAQVGGRLGDISAAVQEMCEAEGFGVVKRVCRPRNRPVHARGPPGAQLRRRAARGRA